MSAETKTSRLTAAEVQAVLSNADRLYDEAQVVAAYRDLAGRINTALADRDPLVLVVMNGGTILAGNLLPLLDFPLQLDYIHATRYRGGVRGFDIEWRAQPMTPLQGRTVLLLDDILDEGLTLAAIVDYCRAHGARAVYTAVLVDKRLPRKRALERADFTGLEVPDRYVFGCGMDYKGYLRNAHGIYAVKGL